MVKDEIDWNKIDWTQKADEELSEESSRSKMSRINTIYLYTELLGKKELAIATTRNLTDDYMARASWDGNSLQDHYAWQASIWQSV